MNQTKDQEETWEDSVVLKEAADTINKLFKEKLPEELQFHNYKHTLDVVEAAEQLAKESDLTSKDFELLLLAAWFHDSGMVDSFEGHEEHSADRAEDFLQSHSYSEEEIKKVRELILSTKTGYKPQSYFEELLHDADLSHLGKKRFFRKSELIRVEEEHFKNKQYSELEWQKKQYQFLIDHDFITQVAKENFEKRRAKNIRKQRKNIHKARKVTTRKKTGKDFGRGIDTLYRANYRNHIELSSIADGKANMMISINTIILSVIVTLSGASLSLTEGITVASLRYIIPILILLLGCLSSVIFAILSARPKVTEKDIDMELVKKNEISMLYFGNFLRIPRKDFVEYLRRLKQDQRQLYDSMSMDIYSLGEVLKDKYRLLNISYNVFMIGLVATVITFIVIFFYTNR